MFLSKAPNGIYQVYYIKNGRKTKISTKKTTYKDAHKFLINFAQTKKEIEETKINPIKLRRFLLEYLMFSETYHAPNTTLSIKATSRALVKHFGDVYFDTLTHNALEKYIISRINKFSIYLGKREVAYLSGIYKWAIANGYQNTNLAKGIKIGRIPERQPVFFSEEEFETLIKVVEDKDLRDIIYFALNTGMRQMEILSLRWRQVNLDKRFVILDNKDYITKSKKIRTIPLNQTAYSILVKRSVKGKNDINLVFTYLGIRIRQHFMSHKFKKFVKMTSLNQDLSFHSLRHSFATWLIQKGVPIYEVSKLLGHSNVKTTEIYTHLNPDNLRGAVNILDSK